jgi:hypothetical protein
MNNELRGRCLPGARMHGAVARARHAADVAQQQQQQQTTVKASLRAACGQTVQQKLTMHV